MPARYLTTLSAFTLFLVLPGHISQGVMELRVFKEHLYVGVLSFFSGFALTRTAKIDDLTNLNMVTDWELITGNGFFREQREQLGGRIAENEYPWSSAEFNGIYFLGTVALTETPSNKPEHQAYKGRAQLWASEDGENWQYVFNDVLDSGAPYMYGYRTMQVTSDGQTLYIGSAANMYIPDPAV